MTYTLADDINLLGTFCSQRDLTTLTQNSLQEKYNFPKADAFVLFGGSVLGGVATMITAMENKIAKNYLIVGGQGHTTESLRHQIKLNYHQIKTKNVSEAEMFNALLQLKTGQTADYVEVQSTNCGNNITNMLKILTDNHLPHRSVILCQDATMQRRMEATLQKFAPEITIVNYASYEIKVILKENQLQFDRELMGMWDLDTYITLLLGEISRLQNTPTGYGPAGKNFIAPVFIPKDVLAAYSRLIKAFPNKIRSANPLYAKELKT